MGSLRGLLRARPSSPAPQVLMVGTSLRTQGGVATVARELLASSLARHCAVTYVASHRDGSSVAKLVAAVSAALLGSGRLLLRRPELLHVHLASRASFWRKLLLIMPAFALRVPVLIHLHGGEFQQFYGHESGPVARLLIRFVMERSVGVVALSSAWKSWLETEFPRASVTVIQNSVGLPPLAEARPTGLPTQTLLFMGRLARGKGAFDLVRAFASVAAAHASSRLIMAGDGEINAIRDLAASLGVADRVDTPGWVSGDERVALYRNASVYVLPSYNEGLPMSVLEAMSYGLPVISTCVGGIPDVVSDGREGRLIQPGDVDALSACIDGLLRNAEQACEMGTAGRRRIEEEFDTEVVSRHWLSLYRRVGLQVNDVEATR